MVVIAEGVLGSEEVQFGNVGERSGWVSVGSYLLRGGQLELGHWTEFLK